MKFLTDENVDVRVVNGIKKANYNIKDIKKEGMLGFKDKDILAFAIKEKRILLTHDKDFKNNPSFKNIKHEGIILLRFKNQSPDNVLKRLLSILNSKAAIKMPKNLTIISETEIIIIPKEN